MSQASSITNGQSASDSPEVLTLAEAADFLRLSESEVVELTFKQSLPGRKIGSQWRFLRNGLTDWLLQLPQSQRLLRHAGAIPENPEAMLNEIYQDRGRSARRPAAGG